MSSNLCYINFQMLFGVWGTYYLKFEEIPFTHALFTQSFFFFLPSLILIRRITVFDEAVVPNTSMGMSGYQPFNLCNGFGRASLFFHFTF